jgi:hypothetical protein
MWGSGSIAPPLLVLALDGSEWSASHPALFTLEEIPTGTHWMGG